MMNLEQKVRLHFNKKSFFKEYSKYMEKTPEYELFLKNLDEKNEIKKGLWCVEIYDILDNNGISKVIKKLYSLKDAYECDYKVDVYYRKSFFKKLQYARVQIGYSSSGILGKIAFNKHQYIRDIDILITQINNNDFVLCYKIHFRKLILEYKEIHECVFTNLSVIKKSRNCTFYSLKNTVNNFFKTKNNREILRLEYDWFRDWLQGIIEQLLFTNIGKLYRLPILFNFNILEKNENVISELKNPFLLDCFVDVEENEFLHISSLERFEGCSIDRYTFGNKLTESRFLEYLSIIGNDFYYFIFYTIENAEIERRLGGYFTSIKRKISINDQKWLINKIRALKEKEVPENTLRKMDVWTLYVDGKKTEQKLFQYPYLQNKYLDIYSGYLDYLTSLNSLNYNSTILWITLTTLILTVIGLIIAHLWPDGIDFSTMSDRVKNLISFI